MNVLADWVLDESFVDEVLETAKRAELVSFDIFDTALTRLTDSPVDVFAEAEHRLVSRFGAVAKGFAMAREHAERDARHRHHALRGAEEISFSDIYKELPQRLRQFKAWPEAADLELAIELEMLVAVPDILELSRRLEQNGTPYIFVSDMYLPSQFLGRALSAAGYRNWNAIFVSNETQCTKGSGRIWDIVCPLHSTNMLHIGDDMHADVVTPRRYGLETRHYGRAKSERRLGGDLRPAVLPFSYLKRHVDLQSRAALQPSNGPAFWTNLGRSLGGIILGSFCKWLEERVKLHGIDRLYFCARDGWLMKQAWESSGMADRTGPEARYLYVSRRPLNLARGHKESTPERLSPAFLKFLSFSDNTVTVKAALARVALDTVPELVGDAVATFGSLDCRLTWADGKVAEFSRLLERHSSAVYEQLGAEHDGLLAYLRQEGFMEPGKMAIVDMGWQATIQRSVRTLVEREHGPISLSGFYYGLWPSAQSNRFAAGFMEAAFGTDFLSEEEQPELHNAIEILEELHAAAHGSVVTYQQDQGVWQPVLADSPIEIEQHQLMTRYFQDGALETVSALFRQERVGPLALEDLSCEAAVAALGAVVLSPTEVELHHLAKLVHCITFDHKALDPIVSPTMPALLEEVGLQFGRSCWQTGTLRKWMEHADVDQSELIRQLATNHLNHLGERTLRQFV